MRDFRLSHVLPALALIGGLVAAAPEATAAYVFSSDLDFSYVGTVTPPGGTPITIPSYVSTPGTTTYLGRDVAAYLTGSAPTAYAGAGSENYTQFGTNWYYSIAPGHAADSGWGSPNNTNTGFFQLLNPNNLNVTATGGWTDSSHTTLAISIVGGATDPSSHYNRLWAAPEVGGPSGDTGGQFQSYSLNITATFAPGAVTMEGPGWYSTTTAPIAVTGTLTGLFKNTSTTLPANNGLYSFDLTFSDVNWARNNGVAEMYGGYYGASEVPEPASMVMLGAGLLGLGVVRRRRRG